MHKIGSECERLGREPTEYDAMPWTGTYRKAVDLAGLVGGGIDGRLDLLRGRRRLRRHFGGWWEGQIRAMFWG